MDVRRRNRGDRLAIVGNVAKYVSSIDFARKGRLGLVATITVGSTIQVVRS